MTSPSKIVLVVVLVLVLEEKADYDDEAEDEELWMRQFMLSGAPQELGWLP